MLHLINLFPQIIIGVDVVFVSGALFQTNIEGHKITTTKNKKKKSFNIKM